MATTATPDKNDPSIHRDIIVLYTPKKTGSSSLLSSIRINNSNDFFVFHTHEEVILKTDPRYTEYKDICVNDIIQNNIYVNPQTGKHRRIFMIDIFRSPIERMMSDFFEELTVFHFNNPDAHKYLSVDTIMRRFNELFPYLISADYFKEVYYYIDKTTSQRKLVYADDPIFRNSRTFDFDKKYLSVEKNGITYIKLRLDDSKTHWSTILKRVLQTDNEIRIYEDYVTENKDIGELYKKFKEQYRLPLNYYQMIAESQQLKFYYTKNERKNYLRKWRGLVSETNCIPFNLTEYNLYIKVSTENRYNFNVKNHYIDEGCLCVECSQLRKDFVENNRLKTRISHTSTSIAKRNVCLIYTFFHPTCKPENATYTYDEFLEKTTIKRTFVMN